MKNIAELIKNNKNLLTFFSVAIFLVFSPTEASLAQETPLPEPPCKLGLFCSIVDNERLEAVFGLSEPLEATPETLRNEAIATENTQSHSSNTLSQDPAAQTQTEVTTNPTLEQTIPEIVAPAEPPVIKKEVKPVPPPPVVRKPIKPNAPDPDIYKRDSEGRKVCAMKNDKPSKSKIHKKVHMDMECCLDPDEIPNPHCYYPQSKYGKFLKKFQ